MKLLDRISPKRLLSSSKNRRSVSRSEPPSFGSGSSSTSSDSSSVHKPSKNNGVATPTSVLPSSFSGDWSADASSDFSSDLNFELAQAFKLIDRDGDGKISRDELAALLSRIGPNPPSESELMLMIGEVDRDGDGCISIEEFATIGSVFGPACGSELRDVFQLFDKDGDGRITAEELLRVFVAIGDERCTLDDCRRMIEGVNKGGDGFVCLEDFTRMMEQQR